MITYDTTVTVVNYRQNGVDRLGKPQYVVTNKRSGVRARLTQRRSTESATFVTDRYDAIIDPNVKIAPRSDIVEGDRTFRVQGSPSLKRLPGFSPLDHWAVELQLVQAT